MSKLIVGNWKMNPVDIKESTKLYTAVRKVAIKLKNVHTVIAPPAIFAQTLFKGNKSKRFSLALQNIATEARGAYTGEISAQQAASIGAQYVIIGHTERRRMGETNKDIRKKVFYAIRFKIQPVICVGETVRDRDALFLKEIKDQVLQSLKEVPSSRMKDIVIAYEPAAAIGAKTALSSHEIHQTILFIRKVLIQAYNAQTMRSVRIIYGGAVDIHNVNEILNIPDIDGVLLGRASLNSVDFVKILETANFFKKKVT